jgi:hypothetical protein
MILPKMQQLFPLVVGYDATNAVLLPVIVEIHCMYGLIGNEKRSQLS